MDVGDLSSNEIFHHDSLNLAEPSIRLIQILPEISAEGLIQCMIYRATVDAAYTALSYRWGAPSPSDFILINNKRFGVRKNLADFLRMAHGSKQALYRFYWIDALCIDQTNKTERVHQVAQMGQIFSCADRVYIWLGANKTLAPILKIFRDPENATFQELTVIGANKQALEDYICRTEYWERAWIIQEVFLAKSVTLWADKEPILFEHLHKTIDYVSLSWKFSPIDQFKLSTKRTSDSLHLSSTFIEAKGLYQGAMLLSLLGNFPEKKCEVSRDRIFSILALSCEGPSITVDYDSPDEAVALDVMMHCHSSSLCVCTPAFVAQRFGLLDDFANAYRHGDDRLGPFIKMKFTSASLFSETPEAFCVDGKYYVVRSLKTDMVFALVQAAWSSCSSIPVVLAALLKGVRQVMQMGDTFTNRNEGQFYRPFCGKIIAPRGHTTSSFLQERTNLWIRAAHAGHPMYEEVFVDAYGFSIEQKSMMTCVLRIALWAIKYDTLSYPPDKCGRLATREDDQIPSSYDSSVVPASIRIKYGDWNRGYDWM